MKVNRILLSDDLVLEITRPTSEGRIDPASAIKLNGNWIDPETAQALARLADRNKPSPESDLNLLKRLIERVKEINQLLDLKDSLLITMLETSATLMEELVAKRKLDA